VEVWKYKKAQQNYTKFFNASQALQEMITDHFFFFFFWFDNFDYKASAAGNASQVDQILDCQTFKSKYP
jgi:hypothetical protein